jgi:hypothetical protein
MRMLDEGYRPNIRADLQYRELEDGGVVYDTNAERIHTLNLAAAYIWNCCDGSRTVSEIASELHEQADVSRERALKDTSEAVEYFEREGLLRLP